MTITFAQFHERRKKFALMLEDLIIPEIVDGASDRPLPLSIAFVDNLHLSNGDLFADESHERHMRILNKLKKMKTEGNETAVQRCDDLRKCFLSASGKNITEHNLEDKSMIHVSIDQHHQETQSCLSVKKSMKAIATAPSETTEQPPAAANEQKKSNKNPYLIAPDVGVQWNFFDDNGRVRTKVKNTALHEKTNDLYWVRVAVDDAYLENIFRDLYYKQKNNPPLRLCHHYVFNDVKRCDNGSMQSIVEFYFLQKKADVRAQLQYFEDNLPQEKRHIYFHSACKSFLDLVCPRWYVSLSNIIKFNYFHSNSKNYYETRFEPKCAADVNSLRNWFFFGLAFLLKTNLTTNTDNLSTPLSGLAFSKPKETGIIKSKQTVSEEDFFNDPRVKCVDKKQWTEEASRFDNRDAFSDDTRSRYPVYTDDNIRDAKMLGLPAPIGACSRLNETVFHIESVDYQQ